MRYRTGMSLLEFICMEKNANEIKKSNFELTRFPFNMATVTKRHDDSIKHKTPFFSLPGGAGTKRMIIWFKLQPQMII